MIEFALTYGFRIFWALLLGAVVAGSLRASWEVENGKKNFGFGLRDRSDTVVWLDPLIFPCAVVLYLGAGVFWYAKMKTMPELVNIVIDIFLYVSIYFTLLLLLLPILRKYYTARTCATLWLIPLFLLYQPYLSLPPKIILYFPGELLKLLICIWLTGFVIIFAGQIVSHIRFVWNLKQHSLPVADEGLLRKWESMKEERNISYPIGLKYCSVITTPLTVGMWKKNKVTYLPEKKFSGEEAELIFSHELWHIQRKDTHTKFFLRFCNALGWIHPFVWLAIKKAEDDLELSCDEAVLRGADSERRKKYAQLLLSIAGDSRGFSTCLSASAKTLRYRLKATMPGNSKRLGLFLLFLVTFLSFLSVGNLAMATDRGTIAELSGRDLTRVEDAEIWDADGESRIMIEDTEGLAEYLEALQVEKVLTDYDAAASETDGQYLFGSVAGSELSFSIYDDYLVIYDPDKGREQYHLCTPTDWDQIRMQYREGGKRSADICVE